jgi:hypothetical protein
MRAKGAGSPSRTVWPRSPHPPRTGACGPGHFRRPASGVSPARRQALQRPGGLQVPEFFCDLRHSFWVGNLT